MHTHTEHSLVQWEDRLQITQCCQLVNKQEKKKSSANRNTAECVTKCMPFLYLIDVITDTVQYLTRTTSEHPIILDIGKYVRIFNMRERNSCYSTLLNI